MKATNPKVFFKGIWMKSATMWKDLEGIMLSK